MRKVAFLASPELWEHGHGPAHPLKPERLRRTYELMDEYGALDMANVRVIAPRQATENELALFHPREYIQVVQALSRGESGVALWRYNFGAGDNPVFTRMYESEALKVGTALLGAELILNGECDVAFSYGGGLHHGGPDFASGFCVFNDAVVAIHWLVHQGLRVAYVDIDVHHGDGVQAAFYDTDEVLTVSLHQDGRTLFPGSGHVGEIGSGEGKGFSVNVPLPPYTDDETYLWAFQQVVPPLLERFAPDILVTQLGVDTHYLDPLASMALTTHGHEALFQSFDRMVGRWLALGGGGYSLDVVPRAWTLALGVMAGQELPDELPASYREKYGGRFLHDQQGPDLGTLTRERTRKAVEETVQRVKELHRLETN
jgi:acetoin utilization protein AcuC